MCKLTFREHFFNYSSSDSNVSTDDENNNADEDWVDISCWLISEITWELEILSVGADNFVVSETQQTVEPQSKKS